MAVEMEKRSPSKTSSRRNEIVAIILLAVAVLFFLSIISYHPNDPSQDTASSSQIKNWIGFVGANMVAILLGWVGWTAFTLPALGVLAAWRIFNSDKLIPTLSRIIGYFLFILSASGILWLFGLRGGIVGKFWAETLFQSLIGKIGTGILLFAFLLVALLLITNLSYLATFGGFQMAFDNFKLRLSGWFSWFRNWRETENAEAKARLEKRREALNNNETTTNEAKKEIISVADVKTTAKSDESKSKSTFVNGDLEKTSEVEKKVKTEDLPPKIIQSEESYQPSVPEDPLAILNSGLGEIPITPIRQTGNLESIDVIEVGEDLELVETKSEPPNYSNYILPNSSFLTSAPPRIDQKEEELRAIAKELEQKTEEFNSKGRVESICQGPVVTTFEFKPDTGVKYSRITALADDLCLALKADSIRIDRIPGKAYVGIEVPNQIRETIHLREVIESKKFRESTSLLTIALGKTIDGLNYSADLAKMPHLLIAGATGAGKSVGVNTLVVSILYKAKPDEVKFIMVDPKRLELGLYSDIPHLATPIITDPKRAAISLRWAVSEMERRYKELAGWGVRNIDGYNEEVKRRNSNEHFDDNGELWKTLPYIVIIIDELADLMMVSGKEVEESITRLAQMARAVGIHLVLATQRPSVDVITGLIKANFPARISFRVSSKIDSRTIIDANGSERLLGKGDMLYLPPATSQIVRVHGAYVDEKEITRIVEHIKSQGKPDYDTNITKTDEELDDSGDLPGRKDPLFMDALRSVVSAKRASTSLLQRHLRIGYGRAAAILDAMVREGFIGEMDGSTRARPILEKAYEYLEGYDSPDN